MLKSMLAAIAAAALLSVVAACSQGPNEEAGEAADSAYEQATAGQADPGQGPQEEVGEAMDQAAESPPSGDTTTRQPDAPPTTTP